MAIAANILIRDKLFIDGEWVEPAGAGTIDVINPATEEVIGRIPEGTRRGRRPRRARRARGLRLVVGRRSRGARRLLRGDRRPAGRARRRAGAPDRQRARDAADAVAADPGRRCRRSTSSSMPELVEEVAWEEKVGNSLVVREPVGVVAAITPWNYPLQPDRPQGRRRRSPRAARSCSSRARSRRSTRSCWPRSCEAVGLPAGRVQPRDRLRPGGGRGDRLASRDRHGLVHRLDAGGPARVGAGRRQASSGWRSSSAASRPT